MQKKKAPAKLVKKVTTKKNSIVKAAPIKISKKRITKNKAPQKLVQKLPQKLAPQFEHKEVFVEAAIPLQKPRLHLHFIAWTFGIALFFGILSLFSSHQNPAKPSTLTAQKVAPASVITINSTDDSITLLATGDVLLARYVELKMRTLKDYLYPFRKVADVLKSADITFGNLETPLMPGSNTPADSTTFRADQDAAQGLAFAGYDVLSLANNHTMNYQAPGLLKTIDALKKVGILYAGGGKNQDEAHTPAVVTVKGKKIAFYAYVDPTIPPGIKLMGEATTDKAGVAKMDINTVKNDVKNALKTADIVVVSMHAGKEYTRTPTQFQQDFAHAAIDAGASAVIGSHSHWASLPYERYGKGVIFYSLGNFVFDQFFSDDVQTGLVAKITFPEDKDDEIGVELLPIKIDQAQPRFLDGDEKTNAIKKVTVQ